MGRNKEDIPLRNSTSNLVYRIELYSEMMYSNSFVYSEVDFYNVL